MGKTMNRTALARILSLSTVAGVAAAGVSSASAAPLDALVAAAKQEGQLTVIALPHDWCNYGQLVAGFQKKYGIKINELNPDAGSGDEVEAIKANKGNKAASARRDRRGFVVRAHGEGGGFAATVQRFRRGTRFPRN